MLSSEGDRSSYNKAQQVIEHRNRLCNNPSYHPHSQSNYCPRPNRQDALSVQVLRAAEDANVYVLACDVAEDDPRDNYLRIY